MDAVIRMTHLNNCIVNTTKYKQCNKH